MESQGFWRCALADPGWIAAVFGVPDDEWGESVAAVVQPADGVSGGPDLAASILASLDGRLARMKWPKSIDFIGEMPRDPTGKLLKRRLRPPTGRTGRRHLTALHA